MHTGPKDQVAAFYKKALGRYGDVITCQGNAPVGTPARTTEGLTCNEDNIAKVKIDQGDYGVSKGNFELKAGSKRHQHIVGFEDPKDGRRGLRWWHWICLPWRRVKTRTRATRAVFLLDGRMAFGGNSRQGGLPLLHEGEGAASKPGRPCA